MRHTPRSLAFGVLCAAAFVATVAIAEDSRFDPHHLVSPPLRALHVAQPERLALPNGTVVFLLEDHTFPVVSGTAYFPSSPSLIGDDRVGLAGLTGEVMRSGGSAAHPGDALDDRLAAIGASVTTSLSFELGYGGFRCLTENSAEVLGLFAEVLQRPDFPEAKIELAKIGMHQEIAGRNDEILPIAERIADQAVYGKGSAWARMAEHATVDAIQRADCRRLHGEVFVPERMVIAVYGDFHSIDMKRRLAALFGNWKRSGTPAPQLPATAEHAQHRMFFAPKDDVTQSALLAVGLGHRIDDPDHAAMDVVEQALGGGSQSRLNRHIRAQRGLAYSTGAAAGAEYLKPGVFMAYTLTRNDSALTALGLLRDELGGVLRAPLGDDEFREAKESVQNQFVFNFEQRSSALFRAAYYQELGYPLDYLARYQEALEAVTPASAFEAARRHIRPDEMSLVVVGKEKDFERPLDREGLPLERVDISIPPPAGH